MYRSIFLFAFICHFLTIDLAHSQTTKNLLITTNAPVEVTSNSANLGGSISNIPDKEIIERGIVYSISLNPTLTSKKIKIGLGIGNFDSITDLSRTSEHLLLSNTTYYVRAYGITLKNDTVYGNQVSFKTLPVGQKGPGGGIVFFDKGILSDGWQFLEAAPLDQSMSIPWGCMGASITNTQKVVGSGELNTKLICDVCNESSCAARLCDDLVLGGQGDWFLPSLDELNLMNINLYIQGKGNLSPKAYWTSSAVTFTLWGENVDKPESAHFFNFQPNQSASFWAGRNAKFCVRAIRAF